MYRTFRKIPDTLSLTSYYFSMIGELDLDVYTIFLAGFERTMYVRGGCTAMLFFAIILRYSITLASGASFGDRFQVNENIGAPDHGWDDDVDLDEDFDWSVRETAAARVMAPLIRQSIDPHRPSALEDNVVPTSFQCGVRPVVPRPVNPRALAPPIVVGIIARERWPWMVQILRREDRELICGGTLLSDRHVITAAHCIKGSGGEYAPSELIIRVGDQFREEIEPLEQDVSIECAFVHRKYDVATLEHDIAVLRLADPLELSGDLLPACLPDKKEFKTGQRCLITGWGYRDFIDYYYGASSPTLNEASVPLLGRKQCRRLGRIYGTSLTKKMQCAGYLTGTMRADTCKKDSGGPLICENAEGVWKLWGVTSWGDNTFCEDTPDIPSPGVYTRVDKYLSWIDGKLSEECPVPID